MENSYGPYDGISALGPGNEANYQNISNEIGEMFDVTIDSAFFRGTDVGLWFRKNYVSDADGLKWTQVRIERLVGDHVQMDPLKEDWFIAPLAVSDTINVPSNTSVVQALVWIFEGTGSLPSPLFDRTPFYVIDFHSNNN